MFHECNFYPQPNIKLSPGRNSSYVTTTQLITCDNKSLKPAKVFFTGQEHNVNRTLTDHLITEPGMVVLLVHIMHLSRAIRWGHLT